MRLLTAGTDLQLLNQDTCCSLQTAIRILVSTLVFAKETSLLLAQAKCMASSSVKLVFSSLQLMKFRLRINPEQEILFIVFVCCV
jgi:hypothetical protein